MFLATFFSHDFLREGTTEVFRCMSTWCLNTMAPGQQGAVHISCLVGVKYPKAPKIRQISDKSVGKLAISGKTKACTKKAKQKCLSAITAQPCQILQNAIRWRDPRDPLSFVLPLFRLEWSEFTKNTSTCGGQAVRRISTKFFF